LRSGWCCKGMLQPDSQVAKSFLDVLSGQGAYQRSANLA
jgi:hypothetical protein